MRDMKAFAKTLETVAPVTCDLKVGDRVTFTNDYGVKFAGKTVIGFDKDASNLNGRFVYFDSDAFWFPARPDMLTKEV